MTSEITRLYVAIMKENQGKESALVEAVLYLLDQEEARKHDEQCEYESRMMET